MGPPYGSPSSVEPQPPQPISNSQNIVIDSHHPQLLGREVRLATAIEREQNLLNSAKVDLPMWFWRLGVLRECVHEKLTLRKVGVVVKGFYGAGVERVGRVRCENLLTVEAQAETQDRIVRIVVGFLIRGLDHEEEFTYRIFQI